MFIGPVFTREAVVAPRRARHFLMRTIYAVALLLLICTAWMILNGTQIILNIGDMARFGALLFQVLASLQLAMLMFLAAIQAASSIAVEKDRQTLILLLMSRLNNSELVLGKLFASYLSIAVMLLTSLPIFMALVLFGGTSFEQVGWTFGVTAATTFATASLGALMALWRERTFQTLALVGLAIVFWLGICEALSFTQFSIAGWSGEQIANAASPVRAILAASQPNIATTWPTEVLPYLFVSIGIGAVLCAIGIWKVRCWNPNREVRAGQSDSEAITAPGANSSSQVGALPVAETSAGTANATKTPASALQQSPTATSRRVWDNPILWRETCTWAYGRKIVFIRVVYWILAACVLLALVSQVRSGAAFDRSTDGSVTVPPAAKPLAPFILLSVVMVNALAVTSITSERDGRALDLLRVTDISPQEFLFGKLFGVLIVALDIVLWPMVLCLYLRFQHIISTENMCYLIVGMMIVFVFAAMLGIHSGMSYTASRQAIAVSLGTVFFLFLGVVTVIVMMVSFAGNLEAQLAPFLACIIGGGIGLYVALGWNMPSPALVVASAILPFAMFYSITSLLLEKYLAVLLVVGFAYGFATAAMMIPRLSEFLVSSDRSRLTDD